jgi:hypothetical protein
MNLTSFTLEDCLLECDLSTPAACEPKYLRVTVCIPEAYGMGSDTLEFVKIIPMMAGVIEKARRNGAFCSKLGVLLIPSVNFEARMSYPGIVCNCSQPVEDFASTTVFFTTSEEEEIYAYSVPFCDIPKHFTTSMQKADSPLIAEMFEQRLNGKVKRRVVRFCAMCKQGAKERKMQFCSRCKVCPYCSKECQKAHWKEHKKGCTPSAEHPLNHRSG